MFFQIKKCQEEKVVRDIKEEGVGVDTINQVGCIA